MIICHICGFEAETFLPYGFRPRQNAMCPKCGSLERHRLLWLYLEEKTDFFKKNITLLDVAPIKILSDKWKNCPSINYTSIDLSSPLAMLKMDITDLKFPENSFDWIICYHVLEHVPDDRKAMRELFRVLKSGGSAIIQVPLFSGLTFEQQENFTDEDRTREFGQADHVRRYGSDYGERLRDAGFEVNLNPYDYQDKVKLYALLPNENIHLCTKDNPMCIK